MDVKILFKNCECGSDKLGMKQSNFSQMTKFKRALGHACLLGFLLTTGCSIEASLTNLVGTIDDGAKDLNRTSPDITYGETVTTSSGTPGYIIKATFGETGDVQTLTNGWKVEGFLYE